MLHRSVSTTLGGSGKVSGDRAPERHRWGLLQGLWWHWGSRTAQAWLWGRVSRWLPSLLNNWGLCAVLNKGSPEPNPCVAAKIELLPKFQWENRLLSFFETSRTPIFSYSRLKISTLATEGADYNEKRKYPQTRDHVFWFPAFGVKSLIFLLAFWVYLICWCMMQENLINEWIINIKIFMVRNLKRNGKTWIACWTCQFLT